MCHWHRRECFYKKKAGFPNPAFFLQKAYGSVIVNLMHLYKNFITYLTVSRRSSKNTIDAYRRDCSKFLLFCADHAIRDINKLSSTAFTNYLGYLKREHHLSARSVARNVAAVRTFMRYLQEQGSVEALTLATCTAPKVGFAIPRVLSVLQIQELFSFLDQQKSAHALRDKVVLVLLYVSGMRVSELINLRPSDIDWHERFVRVFGKGGKERLIPLPQECIDLLLFYITKIKQKPAKRVSHNELLFFNLTRQGIWHILKCVGAKIGIRLYPHALRHSFATHFLANGADLRSLQTILGHQHLTTTQIYTHVDKHQLRVVYDQVHLRK